MAHYSKFNILLAYFIAILLSLKAGVLASQAANAVVVGNCTERISSSVASNGAAILLSAETTNAYKGCKITELRIGFDTSTNGGAVELFLSHDLNSEPFYKETTDASIRGWNTFTLNEPYAIDGEPLYIGYTINGAKYVSTCPRFVEGEEWTMKNGLWSRNEKKTSVAILATVSGEDIPQNDIRLGIVHMPKYVVTNEKINYNGTFQNLGAEKVRNLTFAFIKDGVTINTENVDGLDVEPRNEGSFRINNFTINEEGESDIILKVIAVNGGKDAVDSDNTSLTTHTTSRHSYTKRNVLLEFFSTERCTGCPQAHRNINELFKDANDIVEIGHHAGFYTDQFTIPASVEYEWFYKPGNLHAPAIMFDRTNYSATYPNVFTDNVPVFKATNVNDASTIYTECAATPALAAVNIEPSMSGRKLTLNVSGQQLLPIATPDSIRLCVFLTEDSIYTTSQAGASEGFYHRFSARRCLTATWGDKINISDFAQTYSTDIPEEWNISQTRAVAFIVNRNAKDKDDNQVLNSCQVPILTNSTSISPCYPRIDNSQPWSITRIDGTLISRGDGKASLLKTLHNIKAGLYIIRSGGKTTKICCK